MPKLIAVTSITQLVSPQVVKDDKVVKQAEFREIKPNTLFDATDKEAVEYEKLGAARPMTEREEKEHSIGLIDEATGARDVTDKHLYPDAEPTGGVTMDDVSGETGTDDKNEDVTERRSSRRGGRRQEI